MKKSRKPQVGDQIILDNGSTYSSDVPVYNDQFNLIHGAGYRNGGEHRVVDAVHREIPSCGKMLSQTLLKLDTGVYVDEGDAKLKEP